MSVFLTPTARAVLRRHLFPARGPPRPAAASAASSRPSPTPTRPGATEIEKPRAAQLAAATCAAQLEVRAGAGSGAAPAGRRRAARLIAAASTRVHGGFGGAPKFPAPDEPRVPAAPLAARREAPTILAAVDPHPGPHGRRAASTTSWAAASTATPPTRSWLVPHFEKMLYDNAQLAHVLSRGVPGNRQTRATRTWPRTTLDFMLRELRTGDGGFALRARRGQRGRGGALLRLEPRRVPGGPRSRPGWADRRPMPWPSTGT